MTSDQTCHLALRPYQNRAVDFALCRYAAGHRACYLALEQGLGKTACAIEVANRTESWCLYVAPASLLENVGREAALWRRPGECAGIYFLSDALLGKGETRRRVLVGLKAARAAGQPTLLVVDEAHRFKSETSERCRALFGGYFPCFDRTLFLSGTPLPNGRPIELWPVLHAAAPEVCGQGKHAYGLRYCGAYEDFFGWHYDGAERLDELAAKLKASFMLRLTKAEVLDELPPPEVEFIEVDCDEDDLEAVREAEAAARGSGKDGDLATVRRLTGEAKAAGAAAFVLRSFAPGEALLVAAYHKEVIARLAAAFETAGLRFSIIDGATLTRSRQGFIDGFQRGRTDLLLVNYMAAGVGFNVTAASRVVFAEYSWAPADNEQMVARAHRMGRRGSVTVQYLVVPGTLDEAMVRVNRRKQTSIDVIDKKEVSKA